MNEKIIYSHIKGNHKDGKIYIGEVLHYFDLNKINTPLELIKLWDLKLLPIERQSKKAIELVKKTIINFNKSIDKKGNNFLNPDEFKVDEEYRYVCDNGDRGVRMKIVLVKGEKCFYDCDTSVSSGYRSEPASIRGYKYKNIRKEK